MEWYWKHYASKLVGRNSILFDRIYNFMIKQNIYLCIIKQKKTITKLKEVFDLRTLEGRIEWSPSITM